ncbi:hypothetical protein [Streptomyces bungoensis]|nr:hypothetical protein [Streptomyces bungoensis]
MSMRRVPAAVLTAAALGGRGFADAAASQGPPVPASAGSSAWITVVTW